jgi:hypothetical protein
MQYEKLVEFKRKNGDCNDLRQDRKELLDGLGFVWKWEGDVNSIALDRNWHRQYEKLVEFKRKNGHCIVPQVYGQDQAFARWVSWQRATQGKNKIRQDRKELLDELEFVWKAVKGRPSSATEDVRDLLIGSSHSWV